MENLAQQKPMRSVWHSLLWKEWHEHKWKLLGLVTIVVTLMLLSVNEEPLFMPMGMSTILFGYGMIAGLLIGMSAAAGENGRGTMAFLQSLPVSMKRPALARLLMSLITILLPIAVAIGIGYAILAWHGLSEQLVAESVDRIHLGIFRDWQISRWLLVLGLGGSLLSVSFLLWFAALGVNRSDEIRAGAVAFLAIAAIWFCVAGIGHQFDLLGWNSASELLYSSVGAIPGGAAIGEGFQNTFLLTVFFISTLIGHALVTWWYVGRYGKKPWRPQRTTGGLAATNSQAWLAAPRRSQVTAIIWKQLMQTGPLAVGAAGAIVAMTALYFWLDSDREIHDTPGEVLAGITVGCGFLVTIVAGMGVFIEDVKPQINIFWRSRPVDTTLWFFTKFSTGLIVLTTVFGGLIFVADILNNYRPLFDPNVTDDVTDRVIALFYALVILLMYTLSMACYCWTRQPIYAAVLTLSLFFGGFFLFGYLVDEWVSVNSQGKVGLTVLIISQLITTGLAWYAIRYNRHWQG